MTLFRDWLSTVTTGLCAAAVFAASTFSGVSAAQDFHGLSSPITDGRIYTVGPYQNDSGNINLKFGDAFKISNPDVTRLENGTCILSYYGRGTDFDDIFFPYGRTFIARSDDCIHFDFVRGPEKGNSIATGKQDVDSTDFDGWVTGVGSIVPLTKRSSSEKGYCSICRKYCSSSSSSSYCHRCTSKCSENSGFLHYIFGGNSTLDSEVFGFPTRAAFSKIGALYCLPDLKNCYQLDGKDLGESLLSPQSLRQLIGVNGTVNPYTGEPYNELGGVDAPNVRQENGRYVARFAMRNFGSNTPPVTFIPVVFSSPDGLTNWKFEGTALWPNRTGAPEGFSSSLTTEGHRNPHVIEATFTGREKCLRYYRLARGDGKRAASEPIPSPANGIGLFFGGTSCRFYVMVTQQYNLFLPSDGSRINRNTVGISLSLNGVRFFALEQPVVTGGGVYPYNGGVDYLKDNVAGPDIIQGINGKSKELGVYFLGLRGNQDAYKADPVNELPNYNFGLAVTEGNCIDPECWKLYSE
jgi:hypothetical protein